MQTFLFCLKIILFIFSRVICYGLMVWHWAPTDSTDLIFFSPPPLYHCPTTWKKALKRLKHSCPRLCTETSPIFDEQKGQYLKGKKSKYLMSRKANIWWGESPLFEEQITFQRKEILWSAVHGSGAASMDVGRGRERVQSKIQNTNTQRHKYTNTPNTITKRQIYKWSSLNDCRYGQGKHWKIRNTNTQTKRTNIKRQFYKWSSLNGCG